MYQDFSSLKHKVMTMLCQKQSIVDLIGNNSESIEYPDDLIDVNIFPYLKVDYTAQSKGAYIGVAISTPSINNNEIFKNTYLTFLTICENEYQRFDDDVRRGFCRTDLIAEEILSLFNWNDCFGFRLELASDKEGALNNTHYYREVTFRLVTQNNMQNGRKSHG